MNKKKILNLILIAILLGLSIGAYLWFKPASTSSDGKADFTTQPSTLIPEFEKDETKANDKYVGKVVRFGGVVEGIEGDSAIQFNLFTGYNDFVAECGFDKSEFNQIKNVIEGDSIIIQGSCNGITKPTADLDLFSSKSISFTRCKLYNISKTGK